MIGQYSLSLIQSLQPSVQPIATSFLQQCEQAGIPCSVVQGTRTFDQQQAIYDQGRTAPGQIVSNAPPGDSYHQYGLAFDVVPDEYRNLPNWNPSGPYWEQIGQIGESLGLNWGGRWTHPDRPHFELKAAPLSELKAYWQKFKSIMPISVEPGAEAMAAIVGIGLLYWFVLKPILEERGYL